MNMKQKTIEVVMAPPAPHMVGDGFRVHSFFPGNNIIDKKRMSPFFLMDYNSKVEFSPRTEPRGVGVHPHRGFETVTIAYHGRIAHHDSSGNKGIIGEGDVQWMTAASGLLHKEYHEQEFSRQGGLFQMVQLWVNLPAKDKMSAPKYQEITTKMMSRYELGDNKGFVEVIAGEFNPEKTGHVPEGSGQVVKGPASTFTPMHVYNARLKKDANLKLSFPVAYNTGLLVVEGSATINDTNVPTDHFVLFKNDGEKIDITVNEDAVLLVLSGEPINEPIAQYGPFLMNRWEELEQAIADVSAGKFGVLED
ncbi:MAG TPA: pirin family protein [Chitinophagaceae bacterium]|nr:pirin family protein [Chitinophagaceae bacterium]